MNKNLYIPTKLKVGYQSRNDTYTGQLAYVIYYDNNNVLRKQTSWESWRDSAIPTNDFDNVPTAGFVLNKKVGGYKSDWNYRQAHIRVFDPRGFEFEISVENLLFILAESNCDKGKGLDGDFVYAWDKTDLVLLPVNSLAYQNSTNFTSLTKASAIGVKALIEGATYLDKDAMKCVFLGKRTVYGPQACYPYLFYYPDSKAYLFRKDSKYIKKLEDPSCHLDYSNLVNTFLNSTCGSPIKKIVIKDSGKYLVSGNYLTWAEVKNGDNFYLYGVYTSDIKNKRNYSNNIYSPTLVCIENKQLIFQYLSSNNSNINLSNLTKQLYAVLENGKEILLTSHSRYSFHDVPTIVSDPRLHLVDTI